MINHWFNPESTLLIRLLEQNLFMDYFEKREYLNFTSNVPLIIKEGFIIMHMYIYARHLSKTKLVKTSEIY